MLDHIKDLINEVKSFSSENFSEIESFRIKFLGKKGVLNSLFSDFKTIPGKNKKAYGKAINELKCCAQEKVSILKKTLKDPGKHLSLIHI